MIRFLLKVLVFPILIVLGVLSILAVFATNIYCHVAGFVINLFIVLGVFMLVTKDWTGVGIFAVSLVAIVGFTFVIGLIGTTIEMARDSVRDFIFD